MMELSEDEKGILSKALELYQRGIDEWEWWVVSAMPAKLMKLVAKNYIVVVKRDKRLKYSLNKDKLEEIKQILGVAVK